MAGDDDEMAAELLQELRNETKNSTIEREEDKKRRQRIPAAAAFIPEHLGQPVRYLTKEDLMGQGASSDSVSKTHSASNSKGNPLPSSTSNEKNKSNGFKSIEKETKKSLFTSQPEVKSADFIPTTFAKKSSNQKTVSSTNDVNKIISVDDVLDAGEDAFSLYGRPIQEIDRPAGASSDFAKAMSLLMFPMGGDLPEDRQSKKERFGYSAFDDDEDENDFFCEDDEESFAGVRERFAMGVAPPSSSATLPSNILSNVEKNSQVQQSSMEIQTKEKMPVKVLEKDDAEETKNGGEKKSLFKQRMEAKKKGLL